MAIQNIKPGVRTRGSHNVGIELSGDWFKLRTLTNSLGPKIGLVTLNAQRKFAQSYRDKVKSNIRTGGRRFGYPPHSDSYSDYKRRYGGPSRLLFWSGAMEEAVEVLPVKSKLVGVGIRKNASRSPYHPGERELLPVGEYANILEKGSPSRGIPSRPVFSDTFKEHMGGKAGLRAFLEIEIMAGFAKQGIIVNKM